MNKNLAHKILVNTHFPDITRIWPAVRTFRHDIRQTNETSVICFHLVHVSILRVQGKWRAVPVASTASRIKLDFCCARWRAIFAPDTENKRMRGDASVSTKPAVLCRRIKLSFCCVAVTRAELTLQCHSLYRLKTKRLLTFVEIKNRNIDVHRPILNKHCVLV
jgi:hypothetical protein